jgi:hypothetical protein
MIVIVKVKVYQVGYVFVRQCNLCQKYKIQVVIWRHNAWRLRSSTHEVSCSLVIRYIYQIFWRNSFLNPGPASGWGERGPCLGRWLWGGAKSRSGTGHTSIRSTVAWWFPHLQTKRVAKELFNLVVLVLAYSDVFWCLHMYIHVMLYVYCCKYCWLPP